MTHEINREVITINDLKEVQSYITNIPLELNKLIQKTTDIIKICKSWINSMLNQISYPEHTEPKVLPSLSEEKKQNFLKNSGPFLQNI